MVAGLQRIVDLLRAASGASSVTGQPSTVYVCHCMHVLGAEAVEDSKWGPLLPEEINGHANPNPNPNTNPNPNPNANANPNPNPTPTPTPNQVGGPIWLGRTADPRFVAAMV